MTVGLYMLRCKELGFSINELDQVERGDIFDMLAEKANDMEEYPYKATQADFDNAFM